MLIHFFWYVVRRIGRVNDPRSSKPGPSLRNAERAPPRANQSQRSMPSSLTGAVVFPRILQPFVCRFLRSAHCEIQRRQPLLSGRHPPLPRALPPAPTGCASHIQHAPAPAACRRYEATKYLEDVSCSNTRWAVIGGLTLRETNALEIEFLTAMDFNLSVHPDDYARCATELRTFHAARRSNEGRSKAATQLPSVSTKETDTCAIWHSGKYDSDAAEAYSASDHEAGANLGKLRFSPAPRGPATPEVWST